MTRQSVTKGVWTHRAHGDGEIETLSAVVFLEGVNVKPNLKRIESECESVHRESHAERRFERYLVFPRQVYSDAFSSLISNRMHQQILP